MITPKELKQLADEHNSYERYRKDKLEHIKCLAQCGNYEAEFFEEDKAKLLNLSKLREELEAVGFKVSNEYSFYADRTLRIIW